MRGNGSRDRDFKQNNQQSSGSNEESQKSLEEIQFDEQFRKWEEQFMNWKRDNANHPDRRAYLDYESKMEECRKKLSARRTEMRERRLGMANNEPKIDETYVENEQPASVAPSASSAAQLEKKPPLDNPPSSSKPPLFNNTWSSGGNNSIPGLDLVAESTPTSLAINTILEDPKIKSLLSNIQQQGQSSEPRQQEIQQPEVSLNTSQSNSEINEGESQASQAQPLMSLSVFNPQDEEAVQSDRLAEGSGSENELEGSMRSRRRRGGTKQRLKRLRRQMQTETQSAESLSAIDEPNEAKRPCTWQRNQQAPEFFRPQAVIDYQNQPRAQNQPESDLFPRKIIDYKHKSKIYMPSNFTPVSVVDYNHRSEADMNIDPEGMNSKNSIFPWRRAPRPAPQPVMAPIPPQPQRPHSILSRIPALLQSLRSDRRPQRRPGLPPPPKEM